MRIATYNIWNSDVGMPKRTEQIMRQIMQMDADIICLQEVKNAKFYADLAEKLPYSYAVFYNHEHEDEGLAIFSRFPLMKGQYIKNSALAVADTPDGLLLIANVHLPWESAMEREIAVKKLNECISQISADCKLMLGDFNCAPSSDVQRFLLGECTLFGGASVPCWYDLAESFAFYNKTAPEITLDIQNNPRWMGQATVETSQRYDRILLQNTYPHDFPLLEKVCTFGKEIDWISGFMPSDHYGVYADLRFKHE